MTEDESKEELDRCIERHLSQGAKLISKGDMTQEEIDYANKYKKLMKMPTIIGSVEDMLNNDGEIPNIKEVEFVDSEPIPKKEFGVGLETIGMRRDGLLFNNRNSYCDRVNDICDGFFDTFQKVPALISEGTQYLGKSLFDYPLKWSLLRLGGTTGFFYGFLYSKELKLMIKYYESQEDFRIDSAACSQEYYDTPVYKAEIDKFRDKLAKEFSLKETITPEMQVIVPSSSGLETRTVKLNAEVSVDISKHYNDDFKEIYDTVIERLNTPKDKGLVLFYGVPGSGKSNLLRHLTIKIKDKAVIFLPNSLAARLASPDILALFLKNKNSVLVIEDAEDLLTDRGNNYNKEGVSNLLNVADGLLSDVLNIQIICTFNCPLDNIDKALLRKGRLIAKYEFKELTVEKSNNLLKDLGKEHITDKPMIIADIFNLEDKAFTNAERPKIGFNR